MRKFTVGLCLSLCPLLCPLTAVASGADYAMYVWKTGFDSTVPGCDEAKLLAWDKTGDPECYPHNWEDPADRQWLWDTANRPGREIGRLFISDIKPRLEPAYLAENCSDSDVLAIKEMLLDGHCEVPGVELYALFATSDVEVSEQDHVKYVVWYNDVCAMSPSERFDGVAVNNEAWNDVKCTTITAEQDYLDDLQIIADEAALQVNGTLLTHYSIGWRWSFCDSSEVTVDWGGTIQPATYHMIDIFDSVDAQVAFVDPPVVADRAITAGYAHAVAQPKPFYVLSYTNKASSSSCVTTHFPYVCSATWSNPARTDDYLMGSVFDSFATNGIPEALGGIHYFRGVYSSGGHPDWPSYYSGTDTSCAELTPGPLVFGPSVTGEVSWPPVAGATSYQLARAEDPDFDTECRIVSTTSATTAVDTQRPPAGSVFYYLVRVLEPEPGSWGDTSGEGPRTVPCS